jgi:penicillin amidase
MNASPLSRVVKAVNIAVAIVLAAGLGAVYWFVWRPLPQRSGSVTAAVTAPLTVTFDALGEPHIRAANQDDALFAQGYVTAQDRLFQMDGLRRYASGELSEILGPSLLESDRESRRLRLRRNAEDAYGTLPEGDRAAFAAYARGVNAFLATHLNNLPLEFTLLRYQPRPWSVIDSLLVALNMFRSLTNTWKNDVIKHNMLVRGDRAKVDFLFPMGAGSIPPGSNSWVVAGNRTASGKPILSNDMHLEYSLPGIWYMAHLQAPGLDVAGVSLPGAPGIAVGHNQRIAWGITNLEFDVQDLYLERFDERTGRYLYRGQVEQARAEREVIRVKGQKPVEILLWVTRHGPIILSENHEYLALRWSMAVPGVLQYPVMDIDRARNWAEFTAVLARFPLGTNFTYADVDGNIGYHAAGKLPKRVGYAGDVPVDGSSGAFDWDGFIPFDQLPAAYNPPGGIIATSNQDPFPPGYPYPVNGNFAPPDRARQVRALLSARQGWRAEEMLAVQKDVYAAFGKFLAGQLIAAYQKRRAHDPSLDAAAALLRAWNGQMEKDQAAPLIAALAFQHVRSAVADLASGGQGEEYDFPMAYTAIERLLRERPAGWFRDYDEMLLRAFVDALDEGRRMQGRDVKRWVYGKYLNLTIENPVIHRVPWVGTYFDLGPVPLSGSSTTVRQTTRKLAPSMRMNADLGNWDNSLLNIETGQSGQILSSHYKDQWWDWYYARSYPMQFDRVKGKSTLEFRP